jgi:hypothetical protein
MLMMIFFLFGHYAAISSHESQYFQILLKEIAIYLELFEIANEEEEEELFESIHFSAKLSNQKIHQ